MRKSLTKIFGDIEVWAEQKHVNLADLVKSFPTNVFLQKLASIQKRTSPVKFDHLHEKSEKGSISNLSTKVAPSRITNLRTNGGSHRRGGPMKIWKRNAYAILPIPGVGAREPEKLHMTPVLIIWGGAVSQYHSIIRQGPSITVSLQTLRGSFSAVSKPILQVNSRSTVVLNTR